MLACCAIGVLWSAAVLLPLWGSSAGGDAQPHADGDGRTVARPGHEGDPESVADGAPLGEQVNASPSNYQGTPVVQACNLLTVTDLGRLGLPLSANPQPNIATFERTYIGSDGSGPLRTNKVGIAHAQGFALNKCGYSFAAADGSSRDSIRIAVSQQPYQPGAADMNGRIGAQQFGDVQVLSHLRAASDPDDNRGDVVMWINGVVAELDVTLTPAGFGAKAHDIATTVAANLQAQAAAPTGPSTITYDRTTFPADVLQPCPLLTPEAFTAVYHTELSPLVVEQPATAVGQTTFSDQHDSRNYNYVTVNCSRGTGQEDPGGRRALRLEITSYLSEQPARHNVAFGREQHNGKPVGTRLGDEAVVLDDASMPGAAGVLVIRKGRFVLELSARDSDHADGLTPEQATTMLVPAAEVILRNLGDRK
ncbi:hypothetical protein ACIBEK_05685 [Nocardia fusca]|uniref:hypothetical protein n=1 Tax=Nocardia fusca TaxID=941183 RepID=UPI0037BDC2F6